MPRLIVLFCAAGAFAASTHAAETGGIDFGAINDPLAESASRGYTSAPVFLPVDQAFAFSWHLRTGEGGGEEIVASWEMPVGYYLYRHGFGADAEEGLSLGRLAIPRGEMRTDEYFGESEVYLGTVDVVVPVLRRTVKSATVRFAYQGCAEQGLCYPPAERSEVLEFGQPPPTSTWRGGIFTGVAALLLAVLLTVRAVRSRRAMR
ncbi:MAG: protein-disulfide reductase DsbD family protein [Gammaproteobacteria bacterium]|nr:protein-disulfide reductase DsbD family protein [Gammaproteobacteria bacterium]MDE0191125.1 protein-disulfide reductase DsbD family protein [Gammaproteobacteria bacterium]